MAEDVHKKHMVTPKAQKSQALLPIAMIFTGQGAQWPQMGLKLIEEHAYFRSTIQVLDTYLLSLQEAPTWNIEQTLQANAAESHVSHPCRSQSVCTAIQIAPVDLLRQWGIVPQVVVGHSSGVIAAAYTARHITSREAIAVAYYRGLVVARNDFEGAMMAVGMGEREADFELRSAALHECVRVACKNSPDSLTLSGDEEAIDTLVERLANRKIFGKILRTGGVAYHSSNMASLGSVYQNLLSTYLQGKGEADSNGLTPRVISSVTGKDVDAAQTMDPLYWRSNLESPVDFFGAIDTALKSSGYHFLEIGPHSALELPLKQIHAHQNAESPFLYASAMIRGANSVRSSLNAASALYLAGHNIDFGRINAVPHHDGTFPESPAGKVLVDLPNYPWQHDTVLWNECRASTDYRLRNHTRHDLLGSIVPGASPRSTGWRNLLRLKEVPWLADHRLEGSIVFPAGGYLAMAVEALCRVSPQ
ncbi:MAG: hypothetical protein Q9181_001926 [Wetmoreana brouardii]